LYFGGFLGSQRVATQFVAYTFNLCLCPASHRRILSLQLGLSSLENWHVQLYYTPEFLVSTTIQSVLEDHVHTLYHGQAIVDPLQLVTTVGRRIIMIHQNSILRFCVAIPRPPLLKDPIHLIGPGLVPMPISTRVEAKQLPS
jgi:hypothetical protein